MKKENHIGENNYNRKLTGKNILEIRRSKGMKQEYLACKFGVCQQTISQIQKRLTWKHIFLDVQPYGKELILDLYECNNKLFTRKNIKNYFILLCKLLKMKREKLIFWDDVGVPKSEKQKLSHLQGTSAIQFILTSNIVIHTLDQLNAVFINIFSCGSYDHKVAKEFSEHYFESKNVLRVEVIIRG